MERVAQVSLSAGKESKLILSFRISLSPAEVYICNWSGQLFPLGSLFTTLNLHVLSNYQQETSLVAPETHNNY